MSKPQPSDDAVMYEVEVTVKFMFELEADDDMQAEILATYEWEDNLYRGEILDTRVEVMEQEDDVPDFGDDTDAGIAGE